MQCALKATEVVDGRICAAAPLALANELPLPRL